MKKILFMILILSLLIVSAYAFSGEGTGIQTDPFQITNCTQLQEILYNLNSYYILKNNIDCFDTVNWNNGSGFDPIGNDSNRFNGQLDGQNNNISNLFINRSSENFSENFIGLFGYTNSIAQIKNVGLENINILGDACVGGLIGRNLGIVNNTHSEGIVKGYGFVGGLNW